MTQYQMHNIDENGSPDRHDDPGDFESIRKFQMADIIWMLATLIGITIGVTSSIVIVTTNASYETNIFLLITASLMLCGLIIGLMQVLVFRFSFRRSFQWIFINILASIFGGFIYMITFYIVIFFTYFIVGDPYGALSAAPIEISIVVGILAFIISISIVEDNLLLSEFGTGLYWGRTSIAAWSIAWIIGSVVAYVIPSSNVVKGISGGLIGGAIVGVITSKPAVGFLSLSEKLPRKT